MNAKREASQGPRVLLVVDMVNAFLDPRGSLYCGENSRKIIPFVTELIQERRGLGWPVVYLTDSHDADDPEFETYGPHCIRGTWESELIPEMPRNTHSVIRKHTLSGFCNTRLAHKLQELNIHDVDVVGVCTDICVLLAAIELRVRGYRPRVLEKGVATFQPEMHDKALDILEKSFRVEVQR